MFKITLVGEDKDREILQAGSLRFYMRKKPLNDGWVELNEPTMWGTPITIDTGMIQPQYRREYTVTTAVAADRPTRTAATVDIIDRMNHLFTDEEREELRRMLIAHPNPRRG